ncbi:MAG: hypothetical protein ABI603_03675 [Acidobacteriota bacterium]
MMLLRQALELALIAWLPGAVIFRLPWLDRERRAALDAEERLFWAIVLSVALSLSIVLALAVAHRYSFERLLAADALVSAALAALAGGRLRFGGAARRVGLTAVVPLALVVLAGWRFFPSSEYIIGGKDPGTYLNEGIQIAQRGAIVVRDPVVAAVPPFARDLFFPSHQRHDYYGTRFMGFFITDPDRGLVVGQFPHLFPASIAIGYGIDGLSGARRTVGVWALIGLLAVYFAGARLVGRTAAAAAAALLALHVIEVWFSRYPNAEVVMQALLFAALLANARAHVDRDPFFAPVAGLLLALLLFLRFDAVLGIAAVAVALALAACNGQRPRVSFVAVFAAGAALAAIYLLGPMRAYADLPIVFLSNLPWWQYAALGLIAAAAAAALGAAAAWPRLASAVVRWTPAALTLGLSALALYALWLRHPGGRLAAHDAYALRTFTDFYLTLPALLAALIGLWLVARQRFWRDPALFITVAVFSCFFFFKIRIVTDHFWMARRFVPVILPGALLFAAAAALGGSRGKWRGSRLLRTLIGVTFVALLAAHYGRQSRPLLDHVEYAGLAGRIERLAGSIGDDDLVIAESRDAEGDVHVLALPLAYIYARQVLVLNSARPDKPTFAAFLEWAHTHYRRVLFIGGGGTDLLSHRYGVRPLASERFQVPEYDAPLDAYPRFVRAKEFDYGVYVFTTAEPAAARAFALDVGVNDDLQVLRFHAKETVDGRTMRWTRATSYIAITTMPAAARTVTLWMNNGGRPAAAPPATVTVYLHGQLLGAAAVSSGFAPYAFAVPPELASRAAGFGDPVELKLVTATWNPHDVLGSPDDRELGVMVDRVAVQ